MNIVLESVLVLEAENAAQANVIRRREETAMRLKELETVEKVTEKIDKSSILAGLEGVLKNLVKIR